MDSRKETFDGFAWLLRLRYIMENAKSIEEVWEKEGEGEKKREGERERERWVKMCERRKRRRRNKREK